MNPNAIAVVVLSCAALLLQFLQTRLYSVIYWQHLVYFIVTISLLGLGVSGTLLTLVGALRNLTPRRLMYVCSLGFSISAAGSIWAVSLLSADFFNLSWGLLTPFNILRILASYLSAAIPFVFCGLLILGLLRENPKSSNRIYFLNLLGSALGALIYLAMIQRMGALPLLALGVSLPALIVAIWASRDRADSFFLGARKWLLFGAVVSASSMLVPITPDRNKQYWSLFPNPYVEFSEWNPISRIDVITNGLLGHRAILIDGDAQAPLLPDPKRVLADAKAYRAGTLSAPASFSDDTRDWKEFGVSFEIKVPQKVTVPVEIKGSVGQVSVPLPIEPERWQRVYLGVSPQGGFGISAIHIAVGMNRIPSDFRIGEKTQVSIGIPAQVREVRVWSKLLDGAEILSLMGTRPGSERDIQYATSLFETRRPLDHVLIIGNGGGADPQVALEYEPKRITSIEVNPTSFRLVKEEYSKYLGDLFHRPEVNLLLDDGRSYVKRSNEKFDAITMVGVDSFAAASSGAYVLSESYLYTLEAFLDYWDHLKDGGKLQVSRWHFPHAPRETFRAFVTAHEALKQRGIPDPSQHLFVAAYKAAPKLDGSMATLIVSKSPLSQKTMALVTKFLDSRGMELIYPGKPNVFENFVAASRAGKSETFLDEYPFNVRPATDDAPFFFQYGRWSHLFRPYPKGPNGYEGIQGRWPFMTLLLLMVQCAVLVGIMVGLTLWKLLKQSPRDAGIGSTILYFGCLGLGFMFVEMSFIQRLVLVLGHPIYSIALVVPTLLVSAGLGSLVSPKLSERGLPWGFVAIAGILGIAMWSAPHFCQWLLPLPTGTRALLSIGFLFPIGFFMGMPFPSGVAALSKRESLIPLAWAVNGGFSVLGSVLAIVLAMQLGFSSLVIIAIVLYGIAGVSFPLTRAALEKLPDHFPGVEVSRGLTD